MLKFYISARVLCVCVWPKLRSLNSNSSKKRGISNQIWQDKSVFISYSNIQNHFSLKLSSFGELPFYTSVRVLSVCVWTKLCSPNSYSTKTRGISNPVGKDKSVFISHSNIQNHFSLRLSCFGEIKCYGAFYYILFLLEVFWDLQPKFRGL